MRYARASQLKTGTEPFDDMMKIGGTLQIGKEQSCRAQERTSFFYSSILHTENHPKAIRQTYSFIPPPELA